jgi:hypothetical protein
VEDYSDLSQLQLPPSNSIYESDTDREYYDAHSEFVHDEDDDDYLSDFSTSSATPGVRRRSSLPASSGGLQQSHNQHHHHQAPVPQIQFVQVKAPHGSISLHHLKEHTGAITCMVLLHSGNGGVFCSGGNDRKLIIWRACDGTVIRAIERQEEENLHCLIAIAGNRVVTGSNSTLLCKYKSADYFLK